MTDLSLVIPCLNEAGNLPSLVARCADAFVGEPFEVLFIDNGSRDESAELLPKLVAEHGFARSIRLAENRGYGGGILTGLGAARGRFVGWTHADLQTDPADALQGLELLRRAEHPEATLVKGSRRGRPLRDVAFTWGMAAFEWAALGVRLWDINAQPTLFPRSFFESWSDPPEDFSLDLFAYHQAVRRGFELRRFPVEFGPRLTGEGHNETLSAKLRYSRRTVAYSLDLRRRLAR